MESKLKQQCQDSVGELPNLLLREGGYPHLPTTPIKQEPKSDAWNAAGTKPDVEKVYETRSSENQTSALYQFWNGEWWASYAGSPEDAALPFIAGKISGTQYVQWREVQQ